MSFDLGVWYSSRPFTAKEADERYVALSKNGDVTRLIEPHQSVAEFVAALTAQYPQIDDVPEDKIDACPWTVEFDLSKGHATMPIMWSRVDDVAPFVMELAEKHGLVCYDPQARKVYLPSRLRSA